MATVTLLNKMGGTAPGVKLNPIKLQVMSRFLQHSLPVNQSPV
jgi:hypothetical protein